ncbi:MAG: fructosamine kinase family protein, partial [Gammaproteobacteria bacterium]|nr:fructosamine kinase family protein [Gammaproteobacteria bacterium]
MPNWPDLENEISAHTGIDFSGSRQRPLGGGCINDTYEISNDRHHFFIKLSTRDQSDMFSAEAAGLNEILESSSVRAPKPICWGNNSTNSYIVMEYIDLGSGTADTPVTLGHQLAKMHRTTSAQFGWYRNNTIGSTPQPNDWTQSWIEFYRKHRLGFQFSLAEHSGCGSSLL